MMDSLYVVSIRVEDERTVIALGILGAQSRRPVVAASGLERLSMEGVDLVASICRKRHVDRRASSVCDRNGEVTRLLKPERNRGGAFPPRTDLGKPERGERTTVEVAAPSEIADADADMVNHHTAPRHVQTIPAHRRQSMLDNRRLVSVAGHGERDTLVRAPKERIA